MTPGRMPIEMSRESGREVSQKRREMCWRKLGREAVRGSLDGVYEKCGGKHAEGAEQPCYKMLKALMALDFTNGES